MRQRKTGCDENRTSRLTPSHAQTLGDQPATTHRTGLLDPVTPDYPSFPRQLPIFSDQVIRPDFMRHDCDEGEKNVSELDGGTYMSHMRGMPNIEMRYWLRYLEHFM